ncbi:MAG: pyridoxal-phosphate dependent enzyme, partial [Blastocatellia bacterium]
MTEPINRESIASTYDKLGPFIRETPVVDLSSTDFGLDPFPLSLKLELLQHSGSFKARGAFTNLLTRDIPGAGVGAASGGNHGAAVAFAA